MASQVLGTNPSTVRENAALVDLSTVPILHSKTVAYKIADGVTRKNVGKEKDAIGAHLFKPGATIELTYSLPASATTAELVIGHGPLGKFPQCFITILLDDQTLVGRYNPPRSGDGKVIRFEKWDLTRYLARTGLRDGRRTFRLFVMNNGAAGSRDDYALSSVELYYRTEE